MILVGGLCSSEISGNVILVCGDDHFILCTDDWLRKMFVPCDFSLVKGLACLKAKMYAICSDTHQLLLIKLHHFKLEKFKSI